MDSLFNLRHPLCSTEHILYKNKWEKVMEVVYSRLYILRILHYNFSSFPVAAKSRHELF